MHILEYVMTSGPWNPGFQDSRSALELASFDWFQHVGYESHSVYVKKLDFEHRISKFHHSWKLPEISWNPGYCLEVAIFLPILTCWASIWLNFCHWTWILPQKLKNVIYLNLLLFSDFEIDNIWKHQKHDILQFLRQNSCLAQNLS